MSALEIKNPPLKYNGSKFRLAPWILSHFPEHVTYVSVFGGGASDLLLKKKSRYEFYNDLDNEVFNFFQMLRLHGEILINLIQNTPYHRKELELCNEFSDDPIECARRFYVRCWQARANNLKQKSGWRVVVNNLTGGHIPASTFNRAEELFAVRDRLKEVHFECLDYREVLKKYDNNETLFYLDPPYLGKTRNNKKYYTKELMSDDEHEELCWAIKDLKGYVVLSGYDNAIYNSVLDWEKKSILTSDMALNEKQEVLWINPKAANQKNGRLF